MRVILSEAARRSRRIPVASDVLISVCHPERNEVKSKDLQNK